MLNNANRDYAKTLFRILRFGTGFYIYNIVAIFYGAAGLGGSSRERRGAVDRLTAMEMARRSGYDESFMPLLRERNLEIVRCEEEVIVRGEKIRVHNEYFKCLECGGDFYDPKSPRDHLDEAYREYRRRHNMLQPEEIKELRLKYGLTQGELSKLLGWGAATISRYENGALQDEAHDKQLQLIAEPANLSLLLDKTPGAMLPSKRERLIESLKETDLNNST